MTFYKDNSNFCVEMRILESKSECKETIEKLHAMLRAFFSSSNSRMISPCREICTCLKKQAYGPEMTSFLLEGWPSK